MSEVSKNQVCASCGSSELTICYFKHELDPNKHMTTLTFNTEFKEVGQKLTTVRNVRMSM